MYYTVRQLARKMGVTEHTIRFYTDTGILPCQRDVNNRRIFDDHSAEWLGVIQCLRSCGLSLDDIGRYRELCYEDDLGTVKKRYIILKRAAEAAHAKVRQVQKIAAFADAKVAQCEAILSGHVSDETGRAPRAEG